MSIHFSTHNPSVLATGFYDGTVKVFDISSNNEVTMIADSSFAIGRHHLPVMQLCWVNCKDNTEQIVSISSDERVLQWSLKKSLTMTPLMTLRVDNKMKQSNISSNVIGLMGAVNNIFFVPNISTMFALVTADRRIEIWDIAKSTHDPMFYKKNDATEAVIDRTTILFSNINGILVVGNNQGEVEVFRTHNFREEDNLTLYRTKQQNILRNMI